VDTKSSFKERNYEGRGSCDMNQAQRPICNLSFSGKGRRQSRGKNHTNKLLEPIQKLGRGRGEDNGGHEKNGGENACKRLTPKSSGGRWLQNLSRKVKIQGRGIRVRETSHPVVATALYQEKRTSGQKKRGGTFLGAKKKGVKNQKNSSRPSNLLLRKTDTRGTGKKKTVPESGIIRHVTNFRE